MPSMGTVIPILTYLNSNPILHLYEGLEVLGDKELGLTGHHHHLQYSKNLQEELVEKMEF
jgi:hypothetical protein